MKKQDSACRTSTAPGEPEDFPKFISRPKVSAEEMEQLLDELSAGPPARSFRLTSHGLTSTTTTTDVHSRR
jgi:hypothetical protein